MLAHRRAKIVATMGPATQTPENIEKAIIAGMNVARLNFSHGTHEQHLAVIKIIREKSMSLKAPVTIFKICRDQRFGSVFSKKVLSI